MVFSGLAGSGQVHISHLDQACCKHFAMVFLTSLVREATGEYTYLGLVPDKPL